MFPQEHILEGKSPHLHSLSYRHGNHSERTSVCKQTLGGHKQNFVCTRTQEKGAEPHKRLTQTSLCPAPLQGRPWVCAGLCPGCRNPHPSAVSGVGGPGTCLPDTQLNRTAPCGQVHGLGGQRNTHPLAPGLACHTLLHAPSFPGFPGSRRRCDI